MNHQLWTLCMVDRNHINQLIIEFILHHTQADCMIYYLVIEQYMLDTLCMFHLFQSYDQQDNWLVNIPFHLVLKFSNLGMSYRFHLIHDII